MLNDENLIIEPSEMMSRMQYMHLYDSIGAAMEVYNQLGRGMEELIYQEALEMELIAQNIPFEPQKPLHTWYKGKMLSKTYIADIVAFSDVIIELKSVDKINRDHRAQLFNYLRIAKQRCGALINFGDTSFYCERYWYVPSHDEFFLIKKDNLDIFVSKD